MPPFSGFLNTEPALGDFKSKTHCARKLNYYGLKHMAGSGLQQYQPVKTDEDQVLPESPGCSDDGGGMFQLETVEDSLIRKLRTAGGRDFPGLSLSLRWQVPAKNYFNVDFTAMGQHFRNGSPEVHTTVSIGYDSKASVWPNPTPKFQVREFP
jgi:hypothetical protein